MGKNSLVIHSHETPAGLLHDSKELLTAAKFLLNKSEKVSLASYFLLGRSIELSLKAFLLASGIPIKKLASRDFGHNLKALMAEAVKNDIADVAVLNQDEKGALQLLNYDYMGKRFEYRITNGKYFLPSIDVCESVATKLANQLNTVYQCKKQPDSKELGTQ